MKSLISRRALDKAIERAMTAKYLVDTGVVGTVNAVLLQIGEESLCDAWVTADVAEPGKHCRLQAFGDNLSGEVLISSFGDPPSLHLVGRGREEHGKLLLVQRTGEVFTVVWNSDLIDKKSGFFMTATDDKLLVQLIAMLAQKHFPLISEVSVEHAVAFLMGGASDD